MKENVGGKDAFLRGIVGPGLVMAGLTRLGGLQGRPLGLAALVGGAMLSETAITRTCPLNALFGIDTAERERKAA